jgi:glycosyltransferase involved in cell wall biosynthesis
MNKSPLTVLSIVTQMEAGGAQGAAMRVSEELRNRGYLAETCFLYVKRSTYLHEDHVSTILNGNIKSVIDYIYILINLFFYVRKKKPDVILTYTHYANVLGHIVSRLSGIPVRVATQRNPSSSYPRLARALDVIIGSTGFYTRNIAVSEAVKDSFSSYPQRYREKMCLVYNGISPQRSTLSKAEARASFNLPQEVPLIVNVARLANQKNQILLIKLVSMLSNAHLAIAGDGELKEFLQDQAEEMNVHSRTHFLGEIPPRKVADFLATGDLFAFPSIYEAFGFSLVEAMLSGLPVVVSDISALQEILGTSSGDPAGVLLPPHDEIVWAERVSQILSSSEISKALVLKASARAKLYSLQNMVDGYEGCF